MDDAQVKRLLGEISAGMIEEPVETQRLRLRPFREADFPDFFAYIVQKEQQRLSGNPEVETEAEAREVFDWIVSPTHPPLHFAVEEKSGGRVIGNLSISLYPSVREDETLSRLRGVSLSFVLNERFWRRGIMSELLPAAFAHFFGRDGLDFVNAGCFAFNSGSERLMEKVGMRLWREGLFERDGKRIPTREMILFREDWEKR